MLDQNALDTLFINARSHNGWLDQDISDKQISQIYELMKFGPTAANNSPARITFVKSDEAKQKLKLHLDEGNVDKAMAAPVVAIISYDIEFYEKLSFLFPHTDAKSWYAGNPAKIKSAGEMNATLQGAYFMLAARAVGLDCGPMGGFNNTTLDGEFFPDGKTKSIFICALGQGDESKIFPRGPRLSFNEACEIV
ncbi:Probable NADH dehydrogenase/NAD(P)H nitroreductase [uncultured Gammaproteobacteria bacterium]|uniref:malonic semialdehyde reductase n=1 Tax=Bathymodiolus heckerae thiotrophic gill symbiont TaxID=1052212 RepID=UPI0010B0F76C|nr:malonic semialdehyde reductase [Bathymodiolus heckerae thiotrophic gill symbiont]CAC9529398.1 Probable NADH dehydrogenase/NAD(P)H nitroreductase [uncultured Gammaproteobacteria bacterium]CAC9598038.1 Probable NADH dehydrogenase/NAD(P)H nitroreductase [uncultured Gammaproteobacteria bacterium]CAC9950751.1 Probable NADH dehydrogenase/NAD(P)H nitroreductase [uncultured Gammaproteobacteria bacterium]CAC9964159.1 Probable NADH dehydrogenase/NAD(P)H nitroreductase [uncultured Gammaproteobacteria b